MSTTEANEIYKAPESDLTIEQKTNAEQQFFSVSPKKLVVMYVLTLGLYSLVYFYQHWKAQKLTHELKVIPVLRALFSIFFVHSLFARLKNEAENKNLEGIPALSGLATIFIICSIGSSLANNIPQQGVALALGYLVSIALTIAALHPLYKAQKLANLVNNDENGSRNSQFSGLNWFFMTLGALFWLLSLFGAYASIAMPLAG